MFLWVILGNLLPVITAEDTDKVAAYKGKRSLAKPQRQNHLLREAPSKVTAYVELQDQ